VQRLVYFLFFLSYLNIVTLIPGSCATFGHQHTNVKHSVCIGEDIYDDYDSIWEIFLTDILQEKDVQYQSDDSPVSTHYFSLNENKADFRAGLFEPLPNFHFPIGGQPTNTTKVALFARNSKNAFAQYHDYLFRLTPF